MTFGQILYFPYAGAEANQTRFLICIFLFYGFGYPIGHTAVLGAFSKLQVLTLTLTLTLILALTLTLILNT